MPYLRAATDTPFGAMPYDQVLRVTPYIKDANADRIYPGDFVVMEADGGIAVAAAGSTNIIGVAAEGSLASTAKSDFLVYDHPDQLFVIQDDSDGTVVDSASVGLNADIVATAGNTTTDRSNHEIDSSSATTVSAQLRLIRVHPIEGTTSAAYATTVGQQRKWIVKINEHFYGDAGRAGV